ncbi:MAG: NAD(P)H-hydrate dehydratase [Bacteroidota bacterium]
MKILSAQQTRQLDLITIEKEPIASIDLMERASRIFTEWFLTNFSNYDAVTIFCGVGNNGGDGLAIARMLHDRTEMGITVFICRFSEHASQDFQTNLDRLIVAEYLDIQVINLKEDSPLPAIDEDAIVIDAMFGSGLNRPVLDSYWAELIVHINNHNNEVVAVDIPSGLFADQASEGQYILADHTLTFELPKLAFFFAENHMSVGVWQFASIGLNKKAIEDFETKNHYLTLRMVKSLLKKRNKFGHKGTYGHALLMVGSYGMIGAAILSSVACLRSGAGLLSIHAPSCGYTILQSECPEALMLADKDEKNISELKELVKYKAIGVGCGIQKAASTRLVIKQLLENASAPLVIDADALNIISEEKWQHLIPANSILTPHPKEFERLFGKTENQFEQLKLARSKAQELNLYIILKGAHTIIACPSGHCFFNSTGNPGMAKGGSGDVLTGLITGLRAQAYSPQESCLLGVFLHGLAGDLAAEELSMEAMSAYDITEFMGEGFKVLGS